MRAAAAALLALAGLTSACGSDSISDAEWFEEAQAARSCEVDADCVRLEAVCGCCYVPVNKEDAQRLIELAERVVCDDECSCTGFDYVACEANLCTGKLRQALITSSDRSRTS